MKIGLPLTSLYFKQFLSKRPLFTLVKSWRRIMVILGVASLTLLALAPAWAGDGDLDPSFNPGLGVSKIPILRGKADWTTLVDSVPTANGNALVWGYFTSINGNPINSLAKLTDFSGTVDTGFSFPINGEVRGALLQDPSNPTSNIIFWGSFSLPSSGPTFHNLAGLKWDSETSAYYVDPTFGGSASVFNPGGLVTSVAVMGPIGSSYALVGGYDLRPAGGAANTAYHLIRLNSNFSYDNTYARALSLPGGYVNGICVYSGTQPRIFGTLPQADGSIHWLELLGADLLTLQKALGNQPTSGNVYGPIDGPIINWGQPPTGGPVIIVGGFKNAFNSALNHVAQLNSSLTGLDNSNNFNTNIGNLGGANHFVQQINIQGGLIYLAGNLTKFNGTAYGHVVCLNADGTVNTGFNYSGGVPTAGADDRIFKLYKPPGINGFHILGAFQNYNSSTHHCIARLNLDGTIAGDTAVNPTSTTPGTVYAIAEIWGSDGQNWWNYLVIGGDFTGVNGKFRQNLAFLNKDGSLADWPAVFEGPVKFLREQEDGSLLVAGNFGQAKGYGCTGLALLTPDGRFDSAFRPIITQANGTVADLRGVDTDFNVPGKYNIMGIFAKIADNSHTMQPRGAFARLNGDGSLDSGFNAQISIPSSSNIYVNAGGSMGGGNYGMVGYYLYNGTTDRGFGCVLNQYGDQQKYMLFNGEVKCGTSLSDGRIVLGGKFTQVLYPEVANRGRIAAITPNFILDSSFAGAGANGPIHAMRTQGEYDSGKPLIGGSFTTYNGIGRKNVARLNLDGSLDPSFNPGTGPNGAVYAIRWSRWGQNGPTVGKATLGGAFTTYNGVSRPGIARVFASAGSSPDALLMLLLED